LGLQVFLFSQLEDWFDAFALRIGSPLAFGLSQRDVVLVPKLSFAPVLETSLARRFGVTAGLEFDLPGRFLWSLISASFEDVQGQAPFQAERLRWTLFQLLNEIDRLPKVLAERVQALDGSVSARFELANRLAQAFEGYVVNRSDWLATWQSSARVFKRSASRQAIGLLHPERFDAHEPWQAWLWREIIEQQGGLLNEHPFLRFERDIEQVVQTAASLNLARITLMGMPGLTLHQMQLFARLGQHLDVRWLVMNPCASFWDDLPELAKRSPEVFLPESPWLNEQGPALLGLWGKGQRDYLGMLRELESSPELTVNLGEVGIPTSLEPSSSLNLAANDALLGLQGAIMHRSAFPSSGEPASTVSAEQGAIQVHACQSLSHQLLVLRSCILARLETDSALRLSDCLVLCADLEAARPSIHQVFGADLEGGRLAYRIARSPKERTALSELLLDFLIKGALPLSLDQLGQWLHQSLYLALARIDANEAQLFLACLAEAGFVSDLSIKQGFQASFERLLLGAAMDLPISSDALGHEVLGRRAFPRLSLQALSRFEGVLALIDSVTTLCRGQASFVQWVAKLDDWLTLWIDPLPFTLVHAQLKDDLLELRMILSRAVQSYPLLEQEVLIDAQVFRQCMQEALDGAQAQGQGQLTGALNFVQLGAGLIPPTGVVAVLGMNRSTWPRPAFKDELDLTQAWIRSGDLSRYYQDRADLLEALMAARRAFLLFYQGQDPSTGNPMSPSSQVAELLTTLGQKAMEHSVAIPQSASRSLRIGPALSEQLVARYVERHEPVSRTCDPIHADADSNHSRVSSAVEIAAPRLLRVRDLVDALLDPSRQLLRFWSIHLNASQPLAEHEPLDEGVLGDAEKGSQAWLVMELAVQLLCGAVSPTVSPQFLVSHPLFADGPVALKMAEVALGMALGLQAKVYKLAGGAAEVYSLQALRLAVPGYEIRDRLLLGETSSGLLSHVVLGRGALTANLLIRSYLSHCLVNALGEPCATSIVCLGRAGETRLQAFQDQEQAKQALLAWIDFMELNARDPKLFDAGTWVKETLLPKKTSKSKTKAAPAAGTIEAGGDSILLAPAGAEPTGANAHATRVELEDAYEVGAPDDVDGGEESTAPLTASAELLWKEAHLDPQAFQERAALLIQNIRACLGLTHD
jgi:exonuclease V gamma subunit